MLADVLRAFHEQYPAIRLELAENGSQLLVGSLLTGLTPGLLAAEINRVEALRAQHVAIANLMQALGGGW